MKKVFKFGAMSLAALLVFGAAGCGKISDEEGKKWAEENGYVHISTLELPDPVDTSKAGCDATKPYSAGCSAIDASNLLKYLEDDVMLIDIKTEAQYAQSHLKGAINVNFYKIYPQTPTAGVNNGQTLFYLSEDGRFAPSFANSVEILKKLFPQDKVLFINCAVGGRVQNMLKILDQFGWDMSKVYNIGGTNDWTQGEYTDEYADYIVTGEPLNIDDYLETGIEFNELPGHAEATIHGVECAVDVMVYTDANNKVGYVKIVEGTYNSDSQQYATAVAAGLNKLLNSFVGKTASEITAAANNYATGGADVISGATESTDLIYDAVVDALS